MTPRASIVIIAYNEDAHIERALQSACAQTERQIEVVCVDDGSTDGTLARMRAFAAKDARVKVVAQPNGGTLAARHAGVRAATAPYTLFLDADDALAPEAVQTACDAADAQGADVLEFGFELKPNAGNPPDPAVLAWLARRLSQDHPLPEPPCGPRLINACFAGNALWWSLLGRVFRTELLREALQYDRGEWLCIGEDQLISMMLMCRLKRFGRIPNKLYTYTVGSGMTTRAEASSDADVRRWGNKWLSLTLTREWLAKMDYPVAEIADALAAIELDIRQTTTHYLAFRCPREKRPALLVTLAQYCPADAFAQVVSGAMELVDQRYDLVANSTCWKLTKPLRLALDALKGK